jgi:hypothetical protein
VKGRLKDNTSTINRSISLQAVLSGCAAHNPFSRKETRNGDILLAFS